MKELGPIDLEVLKRYDKAGPRYTSYPTAPKFSKDFGPAQFEEEIIQSNKTNTGPLSLYFHIPFCDTLCYFCGCNMLVTHERQKISDYLKVLEKEIQLVTQHVSKKRPVYQLHWGGGTPTYLNPDEIRRLGALIQNNFNLDKKELEASSEIDPRDLTRDHIVALKEAGFNRLSMGVQDFEKRVQLAVNRVQPESITRDAVNWGRELGFESINLDLMYGLPFQTLESFEKTLDKIIEINPDRLAVFNYAHVPWLKKHMNLIKAEDLPSPELKLVLLKMTIEKLQAAGYLYIGMDHFAKPTDELAIAQKNKTLFRNFQGYSTKAGTEVYAMGMSAISQLDEVYAQNAKTLPEYYKAIEENRFATHVGYRMTRDDHIRKKVIMTLMCDFELDEKEIEQEYQISFNDYFAADLPKLIEFEKDAFVVRKEGKISIHGMGRLLIRNIVMAFDAYLSDMMKDKPVFSRTV